MAILFYVICTAWYQWVFSCCYLWMTFYLHFCFCFVFAVVVIKCFMIGVNVWWVYLAPQNIPRAISVLTLGNKVILYCIFTLQNNYKWKLTQGVKALAAPGNQTHFSIAPVFSVCCCTNWAVYWSLSGLSWYWFSVSVVWMLHQVQSRVSFMLAHLDIKLDYLLVVLGRFES